MRMLPSRCSLPAALATAALLAATAARAQAPTYTIYPAPSSFNADAGEPSLGVDWNSGSVMY